MNLAAILPRFPQVGFRLQHARRRPRTAVVLPEYRKISRHAILTLEDRPLRLRVLRGWVWITRDGCPDDWVLGAGDVFEQQPGGRVLVQALEDAELLVAGAEVDGQND